MTWGLIISIVLFISSEMMDTITLGLIEDNHHDRLTDFDV